MIVHWFTQPRPHSELKYFAQLLRKLWLQGPALFQLFFMSVQVPRSAQKLTYIVIMRASSCTEQEQRGRSRSSSGTAG